MKKILYHKGLTEFMKSTIIILLCLISPIFEMNANHIIPESIKDEVATAMEFYPELQDLNIEFKFKKSIKKSTMQARPSFGSFFKSSENRTYLVLISEKFKIENQEYLTTQIPEDVLVGWIAHELGHIMDYANRSKTNLLWFGVKYLLSENHIIEAERSADTFAIEQGAEQYILKTKDFILNHANISLKYKNRIKKYYLSPEEILELIQSRNEALMLSGQ